MVTDGTAATVEAAANAANAVNFILCIYLSLIGVVYREFDCLIVVGGSKNAQKGGS